MNIKVSNSALKKLKELNAGGENVLRISVIPGGCSGMTYNAFIDSDYSPLDMLLFEKDSIRIVSDMESSIYLDGLEIDFSDDLISAGFRFSNYSQLKPCACGSSFET